MLFIDTQKILNVLQQHHVTGPLLAELPAEIEAIINKIHTKYNWIIFVILAPLRGARLCMDCVPMACHFVATPWAIKRSRPVGAIVGCELCDP